ncbi:MAG: hypothetical protein M0D57_06065 [Sphingobacteriales bacterium JAD_PAG50586_3]|nr:MAG: hypothetical protein M0D57_06065 [Sphingobacteriales bacterium JAD_PAG50586_3]
MYTITLADFKKFGAIHPYMVEVTELERNPEFINYNVKERRVMILGIIPMWPVYTAKVFEVEKGKHIRYTSPVQRGVDLVIDLTLSHQNGTTHVKEEVIVTANPVIAKVFLGILKKAHLEVFEKLGQ